MSEVARFGFSNQILFGSQNARKALKLKAIILSISYFIMRVRYSFSSRRTRTIDPFNQHRTPFPKLAEKVIENADILLEVLDARFIEETRNPEVEESIKRKGKKLIYVLNKIDTIDKTRIGKEILSSVYPFVFLSCKEKKGIKDLRKKINIEVSRLKLGERQAKVGIIGYPNTGKSSITNLLAGSHQTRTSAEPGYTKGIQNIRLTKNILLIDTPGVIPSSENSATSQEDLKKHAEIGVRSFSKLKDPEFVVASLMQKNPLLFEKFYNIPVKGDPEMLLEQLGRAKKFLLKGNQVDTDRTARFILKAWQEGNIRIED